MKRFACDHCGNEVYFESIVCVRCLKPIGYQPKVAAMASAHGGSFVADGSPFKPCANRDLADCNWLLPASSSDGFCMSCALDRTIPNLSDQVALSRWKKVELAKRGLLYSITRWNLPLQSNSADAGKGLAFDCLADRTNSDGSIERVVTGHSDGLITINIAEADDAEREKRRNQLNEPYRTLLGHLRHEVGHYYWDLSLIHI